MARTKTIKNKDNLSFTLFIRIRIQIRESRFIEAAFSIAACCAIYRLPEARRSCLMNVPM